MLAPAYDVIPVPDGEAALAAIARRPPDLILTDVMMPRLDGFALLQRIRADSALQDIPVIVLSARAAEEAKLEGLHTGADDYLVKPFSARELLARVSANLALSQLRRQNRRSEDRLRAIFETTPECIKIVARDGTLLHINPAGLAMVEAGSAGVVEGSSTLDLIAPEHRDAWQSCHQRVCEGERLSWQFDIVGLKGTRRPMETHAAPLRMPDGTTAQLAITLDISQRKRDEAALIVLNTTLEQRVAVEVSERMKAEAALRQAQKMEAIGHLTGGVAHDFNNLLHVIIGSLEGMKHRLARSSGLSPREVARSLDIAMRSAEKAAGLTQSLLAFSRRQPLEPRPIDLNRLIDGMSELLRRTLGESIMVGTVLSEGLWRVSADPNQLENAILNLAVNARDAMPNGGSLTIESANAVLDAGYAARHQTIEAGDYVMFAIRDTGIGMSQDVLAAAFDPFFTTKERGHGTGLGLSQVYGFVKQSDGHIKIKSAPGKGTTVRIYLPRIAGEHTAEDAPSVMSHAPEHRRETVLVVEDDEAVREISAAMLEELGYRVILAGDAEEALHRIDADGTIRLLFSDVGLPGGINGRQLARLALERSPRLKVLFTTGYAQDALVHHGRLDPGIELIAKPFSVASLANKISALLEGD